MNQSKIFIYGVPGSGKTTFSRDSQSRNGCLLIEADTLREIAQKEKTEKENPFLYVGTTEAFQKFGKPTYENIVKGLQAVRENMAPYVNREIEKYQDNFIIEGAFLKPDELSDLNGNIMLIITSDEEQHKNQYFQHRKKNQKNLEQFRIARIIQDYLIKESEDYSVKIIENNFDFKPI